MPLSQLDIGHYQPAEYISTQFDPALYKSHSTGIQRSPNALKSIFQNHLPAFSEKYSQSFGTEHGRLRLERIEHFTESFITCGDYTKGIARIQCTNPECKHEIFRPFSCKRFYLCPSCSQKRAILFGEHISDEVLLRLPHRHFVFAFPKMLRPYFRHNKKVLSEIARLINDMIVSYYSEMTGKKIRTGIVLAFQSFGDFLRYNPHYHSLILEGGFDEAGNFIHIPILDLTQMKECFRRLVVDHFKDSGLLAEKMAQNLLSWKHSGFNINNSIRLMGHDNKARESLAQYIARCPISLKKIIYESFKGKVIFKTKYNAYFKENLKVYDPVEFIGLATQHIPVPRVRLIRYFGLYSSKSRGKWHKWDHIIKHAPEGWEKQNAMESQEVTAEFEDMCDPDAFSHKKSKASWARLIAKIYEVDPLICPKCSSEMRVIAIITSEYEVIKILRHLAKTGKSPPGILGVA